ADLATLPPPAPAAGGGAADAIRFTRAIAFERVSYTYEGERDAVLIDVELTIAKGEAVAIVGPSGAGKSTLVDGLLGLLRAASGSGWRSPARSITSRRCWSSTRRPPRSTRRPSVS